jgi:hypothetical protein
MGGSQDSSMKSVGADGAPFRAHAAWFPSATTRMGRALGGFTSSEKRKTTFGKRSVRVDAQIPATRSSG